MRGAAAPACATLDPPAALPSRSAPSAYADEYELSVPLERAGECLEGIYSLVQRRNLSDGFRMPLEMRHAWQRGCQRAPQGPACC